jgi:hypothetical protein
MKGLVIAFILGIVVDQVGVSGVARIFDKGISTIKTQSQELAK